MATATPDAAFCARLPKVELHAHLNGSITPETLQTIWEARTAAEGDLGIEAPRTALSTRTHAQGIESFFAHFGSYVYRLVATEGALRLATREVVAQFAADGVAYLELRTTPRALPGGTAEGALRLVLGELGAWNAGAGGARMPVRLIVSVDRVRHSPAQALAVAELALALRAEGHPVVGLDLCGDVNVPCDVAARAPAFAKARAGGLGLVPHFGEVPASSSPAELEELLSWRPARLGHAIHLPPALRERVAAAGIAPELCLTCNVLGGMLPQARERTVSIVDHHFGWWWARGGPLCLGTDDVGVFGATSTDEHLAAATHFGLSPADLVDLSRRAASVVLGGDGDKARLARLLDQFEQAEGLQAGGLGA